MRHDIKIKRDMKRDDNDKAEFKWQAQCECGWRGARVDKYRDAEDEARRHTS